MNTEPGWFPDPVDPDSELYFDGSNWTGEKRSKIKAEEPKESVENYSISIPVPSKYLKKRNLIAALSIFAIVFVGFGVVKIQMDNNAKKEAQLILEAKRKAELKALIEEERIKNDVSWVPSGFNAWSDDKTVAWKWVDANNDCYSCRYWTVEVISKNGCYNGLYGEMNIERNNVVVSYTNDSLSYLSPMQKGRLSFETYLEGSIQGSLTELNCR